MLKTARTVLLITLLCASHASAQSREATKAFANFNVGFQTQSHSVDTTTTFAVYGQEGKVAGHSDSGTGPFFDFDLGYRLWSSLGVAVGYSYYTKSSGIGATATIPSPIVSNQPASVDVSVTDATRTDKSVYLLAVWFMPLTDKIEASVSAGPSKTSVDQDMVNGMNVVAGTQTGTAIVGSESASAWGVNVGVDAAYLLSKHYGVNLFMRYNGATVDFPSAQAADAGGFQLGFGGRVRF